jgi:hypothetical protein
MKKNMKPDELELGWCPSCERASYPHSDFPPDEMICPGCGEEMKPVRELNREQREDFNLHIWMEEVQKSGKWGPSPGGAASNLGCDRTMIDKLSDRGILEKSVYNRDGHYIVMISRRSIEKAKENKEKRGKWTDSGED